MQPYVVGPSQCVLAEAEEEQKEVNSQMLDEGMWNVKSEKGELINFGVLSWDTINKMKRQL